MKSYFFEEMLVEESAINVAKLGKEYSFSGFNKITLEVDELLSKRINRRKGSYVTLNVTGEYDESKFINEVASAIKHLVGKYYKTLKSILVVGLGNEGVVADSLGSKTVGKISVGKNLRVQKFCPSVKGLTNIDSVNLVKAVVKAESPELIMVIDSLATRDFEKLVSSVQITDSGIVAGGGVSKSDKLYEKSTMGVPVIAIGVPMIINLVGENTCGKNFLCPHEIDIFTQKISEILAKSINLALE